LLARHVDGIAKQSPIRTKARLLELVQQIAFAETIDARKLGNIPVDSRAKIFDGPAIGI
jgi:hypothetical protein